MEALVGVEVFWLIFSIVLTIGLLVFLLWFIYRQRRPKTSAPTGKEYNVRAAVNAAKRFADSSGYQCIAPYSTTRDGKTATLDAVVVGYFGVLGVKALGYNGEVYGGADEERWLRVSDKGDRTYFANPMREAAADVRVLRDALFAEKLKQVPVEVVCVFTAKNAQLALPRTTGHFTLKEFKALLRKEKYQEDKGTDIEKAKAALLKDLPGE